MKPGNFARSLLGGAFDQKEKEDIPSPKKPAVPSKQKTDDDQNRVKPKEAKGSKYDEVMQFMEGIEEEMTSQYEKSSQRLKGNKAEIEEINSGLNDIGHANLFGRAGGELASILAEQSLGGQDKVARERNAVSKAPTANTMMSDLAEIEESLNSSSRAMNALMKQGASAATTNSKVEPREAYQKIRERMLELEIEQEEQQKAMELLKEVRNREKESLTSEVQKAREEGGRYADQVKNEMASRIEK